MASGGGRRKVGQNKKKCKKYKDANRLELNKLRKAVKEEKKREKKLAKKS